MPILKPSKKTAEQFKDWLIYSPSVSRQSTGNPPPPQDSKEQDDKDPTGQGRRQP